MQRAAGAGVLPVDERSRSSAPLYPCRAAAGRDVAADRALPTPALPVHEPSSPRSPASITRDGARPRGSVEYAQVRARPAWQVPAFSAVQLVSRCALMVPRTTLFVVAARGRWPLQQPVAVVQGRRASAAAPTRRVLDVPAPPGGRQRDPASQETTADSACRRSGRRHHDRPGYRARAVRGSCASAQRLRLKEVARRGDPFFGCRTPAGHITATSWRLTRRQASRALRRGSRMDGKKTTGRI